MKILIALLFFVMMCFGASTKDTTKTVAKKAKASTSVVAKTSVAPVPMVLPKTAPVQPVAPKSAFEETVNSLKKQLSEIDKIKVAQKSAQDRIEKESISLDAKSDSVYNAAKTALKSIYDKESDKITSQEQALMLAKDKLELTRGTLEQSYQDAIRSADEAKGGKK